MKQPRQNRPAVSGQAAFPETQLGKRKAYVVRGGFTLLHKNKVYRAGEVIDLTDHEHAGRKHMVEAAPTQEES